MLIVKFENNRGPMPGASAESRDIETHRSINSTPASTHAKITTSIARHRNLKSFSVDVLIMTPLTACTLQTGRAMVGSQPLDQVADCDVWSGLTGLISQHRLKLLFDGGKNKVHPNQASGPTESQGSTATA